jgi:hypothetical protein
MPLYPLERNGHFLICPFEENVIFQSACPSGKKEHLPFYPFEETNGFRVFGRKGHLLIWPFKENDRFQLNWPLGKNEYLPFCPLDENDKFY